MTCHMCVPAFVPERSTVIFQIHSTEYAERHAGTAAASSHHSTAAATAALVPVGESLTGEPDPGMSVHTSDRLVPCYTV